MPEQPKLPLAGIRILDLARLGPGPHSSQILADFGAEVIKLEPPSKGGKELSMPRVIRRNTRSIILNLKSDKGREVFRKLVATVDVVMEGFRPGVAQRLGIDYESLRQIKPDIICVSLTGFGQDGPYREVAGHDINYQSLAGILHLTGDRDGPPRIPGNAIADDAGGIAAALAIAIALLARERTGVGQYVDMAMVDTLLTMMLLNIDECVETGVSPRRGETMLTGAYPFYNVYECKDGKYLSVGAIEPWFWENLCRRLGREDLIEPQRPEPAVSQAAHRGVSGDLPPEDPRRVGRGADARGHLRDAHLLARRGRRRPALPRARIDRRCGEPGRRRQDPGGDALQAVGDPGIDPQRRAGPRRGHARRCCGSSATTSRKSRRWPWRPAAPERRERMEFDWSPEELAFRQEVREFLAKELTDEVRGSIFIDTPARVAFVDKMAERGWLGMGFPEEYGGSKRPIPLAQFILNVELEMAGAPIVGKNVGVIANTIFHEGSEEMKREFLPKIFQNQGQWALTYTEPGAGTDIGSLQCPAIDKGDHFEITGTKIFITSAHFADYHWIAVRTDPNAPKHKGISILIMDAKSEGLSLTPMYCVGTTGKSHRTNEVHLDHVKVPKIPAGGRAEQGLLLHDAGARLRALRDPLLRLAGAPLRQDRRLREARGVGRRAAGRRPGGAPQARAPGRARRGRHDARAAVHLHRGRARARRRGRDEQGVGRRRSATRWRTSRST